MIDKIYQTKFLGHTIHDVFVERYQRNPNQVKTNQEFFSKKV